MSGMLDPDDMIDLIHSVKLGLTRFQIYTVMSEATLVSQTDAARRDN